MPEGTRAPAPLLGSAAAPLLGALALTLVLAPGSASLAAEPIWEVPHGWTTGAGSVVLNDGHIDIASTSPGDDLGVVIRDTSGDQERRYAADEVILQVRPEAETVVPDDPAFAFLGGPGDPLWILPEIQQPGLLWPGWSTEELPLEAAPDGVDWTLRGVDGPGDLILMMSVGGLGEERVVFGSRDGVTAEDTTRIPPNTHAHGSWVFTAEGQYCLDFAQTAIDVTGSPTRHEFTLAFAVGRTDVSAADAAACGTDPDEQPTEPDTTPHPAGELSEAERGGVTAPDRVLQGQTARLQLGGQEAGQWVSAWLDDTHWLGWHRADPSGDIQVPLSSNTAPGAHRVVVEHRDGSLLGWDDLVVVEPDTQEPGGEWDVPNGTVNEAGATVLNDGHVDIAALIEDDALVSRVKDTTESSEPVWRDPAHTVLQVLPSARTVIPTSPTFSFLGDPGDPLWQLSHVQQPGLLWPGWSTESIAAGATSGGVAWGLAAVEGPGEFFLYQPSSTVLGAVDVLFSTADGIDVADRFTIAPNTHAHGSWAFSAEGLYCLAFDRAATLASGQAVAERFVVAMTVGEADVLDVDPAECEETVGGAPGGTPPPPPPAPTDQSPPAQQVAATQCTASATILSSGHIDYASRIVDGALQSLVGDDTGGSKVYREPEGVVLWLKPESSVTLPGGYEQVGPGGSTLWQVPQTQNAALIWLGWNTESLNAGNTRGPVAWTLDRVDGPGAVTVYLAGPFGGVQTMVFDGGGRYDIPLGVHAHANWAFSEQGVYRLTMSQTATLADGSVSTDTETLTIAVGAVDPATALPASACGPAPRPLQLDDENLLAASQARADAAGGTSVSAIDRDADTGVASTPQLVGDETVPLLLSVLGLLLLLGAAGTAILWWRSTRSPT